MYKIGLIRTSAIRILLICSTEQLNNDKFRLMRETQKTNSYPAHLIKRSIREAEEIVRKVKSSKISTQ